MRNAKRLRLLWLVALLLLVGCGVLRRDFVEPFDNPSAWGIRNVDYVTTEVVDGRFLLSVDFPDSLFWTTAGRRNLGDGRYAVTVAPLAGSAESAHGLVLRASPGGNDFYYFLISGDGFFSSGRCLEGCSSTEQMQPFSEPPWTPSPLIRSGFNESHVLTVDAVGSELVFSIDGSEVARHGDDTLERGDIGIIVQTFDSAATVAFDDLRFTPATQE